MKQHITREELNAFLEVVNRENYNKDRYRKLYRHTCPNPVIHENLTIGKMIEILNNTCSNINIAPDWYDKDNGWEVKVDIAIGKNEGKLKGTSEKELCDALWEAVKEVI